MECCDVSYPPWRVPCVQQTPSQFWLKSSTQATVGGWSGGVLRLFFGKDEDILFSPPATASYLSG